MAGGRGKRGRGVGILGNVGRGLVVLQEGENPADAGQGHFRFPLPEGEEGQEEEAGEEDKDGRWETVYALSLIHISEPTRLRREEEVEYCFKDFHKLEGFFNF